MKIIFRTIQFLFFLCVILGSFAYVMMYTPIGVRLSFHALKFAFPKEKTWNISHVEGQSWFDFSLRNVDIQMTQTTTHIDRIHLKWMSKWQSPDHRWVIEAFEIFNMKSHFHGELNHQDERDFIEKNKSQKQEFNLLNNESIKSFNEYRQYFSIDLIDLNQFDLEDDHQNHMSIRVRLKRDESTMNIEQCHFKFNNAAFKCEGKIDENWHVIWKINAI
jgi:hypothetical protein